jgi:hypothetical protein
VIREPPQPEALSATSEPTPRGFERRGVTLRRPSDGREPIALPLRAQNPRRRRRTARGRRAWATRFLS